MPNGPMNVSQTMTQTLKYTADEVGADGSVTLRQTFQSVRMESSGPMGKIVIDSAAAGTSDNPTAQSVRQIMTAMIGESVIIQMGPDGAVRKVDGASRIADKITIAIAAADPAAGAADQGLRSQLSDDALKNTLEQTFPKMSAPPARTDSTWNGEFSMGNPVIGRIVGRSTFTLKAIEGTPDAPLARIAVALALKQDGVPPPSGPSGMVMTLGDAKGVGEILFNVTRGQIQRSTMRTDLPSTVTMNGPDGSPADDEQQDDDHDDDGTGGEIGFRLWAWALGGSDEACGNSGGARVDGGGRVGAAEGGGRRRRGGDREDPDGVSDGGGLRRTARRSRSCMHPTVWRCRPTRRRRKGAPRSRRSTRRSASSS